MTSSVDSATTQPRKGVDDPTNTKDAASPTSTSKDKDDKKHKNEDKSSSSSKNGLDSTSERLLISAGSIGKKSCVFTLDERRIHAHSIVFFFFFLSRCFHSVLLRLLDCVATMKKNKKNRRGSTSTGGSGGSAVSSGLAKAISSGKKAGGNAGPPLLPSG